MNRDELDLVVFRTHYDTPMDNTHAIARGEHALSDRTPCSKSYNIIHDHHRSDQSPAKLA